MSVFPMPWRSAPPQSTTRSSPRQSLAERLQEAERRCYAAERELERVIRESDAEVKIGAAAVARLSESLNRERARANEFEQMMGAMGREFAILNNTATSLAERAGISVGELAELKSLWAKASVDPDHAAVGLHQSAPDFLVRAARTVFRKAYHPDTKAAHEKAAAESAFKRHEAAFERLFQMRGLSG